ncbi:MAG: hypothetical protein HGA19_23455 [Oscillochloris sp.]|nr:hypothetical protein [Oscillochloris sp.]
MMDHAETHEMELLRIDETGTEEWYCPSCGRHFLMRWPPDYQKTVLMPGDVYATHLGGKGGLRMGVPMITDAGPPLDDDLLAPWRRVLDQIDPDQPLSNL